MMVGKLTKKQRGARDALVEMNKPENRDNIITPTGRVSWPEGVANQEQARASYASYMARQRLHGAIQLVARNVASSLPVPGFRQQLLNTTWFYHPATEVACYGLPSYPPS